MAPRRKKQKLVQCEEDKIETIDSVSEISAISDFNSAVDKDGNLLKNRRKTYIVHKDPLEQNKCVTYNPLEEHSDCGVEYNRRLTYVIQPILTVQQEDGAQLHCSPGNEMRSSESEITVLEKQDSAPAVQQKNSQSTKTNKRGRKKKAKMSALVFNTGSDKIKGTENASENMENYAPNDVSLKDEKTAILNIGNQDRILSKEDEHTKMGNVNINDLAPIKKAKGGKKKVTIDMEENEDIQKKPVKRNRKKKNV